MGYKPSYGLVSRYGLIAYGSTFDQVGTLSHNVDDAARVLSVIAGPDEFDSTLNPDAAKNFSVLDCNLKEIKIGYIENMLNHEKIDSVIKEASFDFIEILRSNEVEVTATDFSLTDFLVPTYYILTAAEASSNLSRFDGVRYGHRSDFETDD